MQQGRLFNGLEQVHGGGGGGVEDPMLTNFPAAVPWTRESASAGAHFEAIAENNRNWSSNRSQRVRRHLYAEEGREHDSPVQQRCRRCTRQHPAEASCSKLSQY